jgi:hypothetical protein
VSAYRFTWQRVGYAAHMFKLARTSVRHLVRPISRPSALFLAWTHRYTLALWARSLQTETRNQLAGRSFAPKRWVRLLRGLWRVTRDPRLANAPDLRRLTVVDDRLTPEVPLGWHAAHLLNLRIGTDPAPAEQQETAQLSAEVRTIRPTR